MDNLLLQTHSQVWLHALVTTAVMCPFKKVT